MNRKQLVSMWCGIVAIGWVGYLRTSICTASDYVDWNGFFLWAILISLITGGLILTFRDKKRLEGEAQKPGNRRRGFRRITLVLAIVGGVCGCLISTAAIIDAHDSLRFNKRVRESYKNAIETGNTNIPQKALLSDAVAQASRLKAAENNFWVNLSTGQAVALCVLSGIGGFCGVWLVYLVVWFGYKLIMWLTLGFRVDTG